MSGNEEQADTNLLSAFALTIGGAIGVALTSSLALQSGHGIPGAPRPPAYAPSLAV